MEEEHELQEGQELVIKSMDGETTLVVTVVRVNTAGKTVILRLKNE